MKKSSLVLSLIFSLALISCNGESNPDTPTPPEPVNPTVELISKDMEVVYYSPTNKFNVETFYRNDKLTTLPHISLKKYYSLLTKHEMTVTKQAPGVYKCISANNVEAIIDVNNDTLYCLDYENFISTTIYRQDNVKNYYYDGSPFLRIKDSVYETAPDPISINFKKYEIDLLEKDDDIILPVVTASNLFTGPTMITCFTTKDHLYFIDPNNDSYETSSYASSASVQNEILRSLQSNRRSEEDARFAYYELCFLLDMYYGLPGREYLHEDYINNRDIDYILSNKSDVTRKAKELLMSNDVASYFAGITMLNSFLSDAGHTVIDSGQKSILNNNSTLKAKVKEILDNLNFNPKDYAAKSNYDFSYLYGLYTAYYDVDIANNTYERFGDTLVYRFESFMFDLDGWIAHYKNPSSVPFPDDALYRFKKMLDDHENDSTISNIILDITFNGGGYGDMVVAMMGLMSGKCYDHSFDTVTNNYVRTTYDFDANFDGVFNDEDKEVSYHYNYAVLSSAYSFSCGNLLPAQAKDCGIMLLGDKSGGGACAVVDTSTAEGLYVRLSCQCHLVMDDYSEVDGGVEPDYYTISKSGTTYDFSKFFDFADMSTQMHTFYGN